MYFSCIFWNHVFLMYFSCISHVFLLLYFKKNAYMRNTWASFLTKQCISHVSLMYYSCIYMCMYFSCISHVFAHKFSHVYLMYFSCNLFYFKSRLVTCISHVFRMYFACISHVFLMYFIIRIQCIFNVFYLYSNSSIILFLH